jgi:uncharacterized delta-60 repeat protein
MSARRLKVDGTLDATFSSSSSSFQPERALALQSDGKVVLAQQVSVRRVNSNGTPDSGFSTANTAGGFGNLAVALQADGKILVAGSFSSINGTPRSNIARLNADGTVDGAFVPQAMSSQSWVGCIGVQPDGKIVVGGNFGSIGSTPCGRIARLNVDGSVDSTFQPGLGASGTIHALQILGDGRISIVGEFGGFNGQIRNGVARLLPSGALDASLDPGAGPSSYYNYGVRLRTLLVQSDGHTVVGGTFDTWNDRARGSLTRINGDGSHDLTFNPGRGTNSQVSVVSLQPDGKILIGGWFRSYNDNPIPQLARLNLDGSFDATFAPFGPLGITDVNALAIQPDGKVLVNGSFVAQGVGYTNVLLKRLNADGSQDNTFIESTANGRTVFAIALQPDGKILVGGAFSGPRRFNSDGSLDSSFLFINNFANGHVRAMVLQPDGKILVGGDFTQYGNVARNKLARLNADGTLDLGFNPIGPNAGAVVHAIALQADGKVLVGGTFSSFGGLAMGGVARLFADGTHDTSFAAAAWGGGGVYRVAIQADGKVIIGGSMGSPYNGHVARLNADGSRDMSFNSGGVGASSTIHAMALQPDGRLVIGGQFTTFNGTKRTRVARLLGDPCIPDSDGDGINDCVDNCVAISNASQVDCDLDGAGDVCELAAGTQWDTNGNGTPDQCEACPNIISYCTAGTTTNGCVPSMSSTGTPSIGAGAGFEVRATGIEGQKQALLFYGVSGPNNAPWTPNSSSRLCVRTPVQRMPSASTGGAANACNGAIALDFLGFLSANSNALGQPFAAGMVVNMQAWFRDPPAPGTTNLSNALQFTFCP